MFSGFIIQWINDDISVLEIKIHLRLADITKISFDSPGLDNCLKVTLLPKLTHLFIALLKSSKRWSKQLEKTPILFQVIGIEKKIRYQKHHYY